ncbi:transcriptional regulator [Bacillus sp. MUM 116]|uniref:helix-turn-helix domain-containing protein n=1 Tax=Bacillus sp. MUM 116 TaxID=1678002 RepID=UPI0008F56EFB|nr:helix-turn-helix transcriptional regulator [Bacillus sp. MUM 116]OIK09405.1 transcriptional regulator [Bacillus sp. MUM 116]
MEKKVIVKLKSFVEKHDLSIREMSRLTDIPRPTLSKLRDQKRQNIHLNHILRIATAFNINDIREIIDLEDIHTD